MPTDRDYAEAALWADKIEAALRQSGMWQETPLAEEAYHFTQAFGMDTMAFSQWLQFILLDRIRSIVASKASLPSDSQVAAQAVREFDGDDNAADLLQVLAAFDYWICRR